jgi:hypothetical protein
LVKAPLYLKISPKGQDHLSLIALQNFQKKNIEKLNKNILLISLELNKLSANFVKLPILLSKSLFVFLFLSLIFLTTPQIIAKKRKYKTFIFY